MTKSLIQFSPTLGAVDLALRLLKISRPRFWLYTAGPFAVGSMLGANQLSDLAQGWLIGLFVYFLLPFNFFVYSVNDLFDRETDAKNPKKEQQEHRLASSEVPLVKSVNFWIGIISLLVLWALPDMYTRLVFTTIFLLAGGYSIPPLRFKARPMLDSLSNVFYILPGVLGFLLMTDRSIDWLVVLAAALWSIAMHLYSAVPDITFDKHAGLKTSAVVLGPRLSLAVCVLAWTLFAGLSAWRALGTVFSIVVWLYPGLAAVNLLSQFGWAPLQSKRYQVSRTYWVFPILTTLVGMIGTIEYLLHRLA